MALCRNQWNGYTIRITAKAIASTAAAGRFANTFTRPSRACMLHSARFFSLRNVCVYDELTVKKKQNCLLINRSSSTATLHNCNILFESFCFIWNAFCECVMINDSYTCVCVCVCVYSACCFWFILDVVWRKEKFDDVEATHTHSHTNSLAHIYRVVITSGAPNKMEWLYPTHLLYVFARRRCPFLRVSYKIYGEPCRTIDKSFDRSLKTSRERDRERAWARNSHGNPIESDWEERNRKNEKKRD